MKKYIFAFLLVICTVFCALAFLRSDLKVNIYTQSVGSECAYINLSGEKIASLDELAGELSKLSNLKSVDLGNYEIDVRDIPSLTDKFPGVSFSYSPVCKMYGLSFPVNTENLDLSAVEITDSEPLLETLGFFSALKSVSLGENALPEEQVNAVRERFPQIDFNAVTVYDVYGRLIRDDATEIDLSGVAIDGNLTELLSKFPALKTVNLYDVGLSVDDKLNIKRKNPDIDFGWIVDVCGVSVDSHTAVVNMNNKYMPGRVEEFKKVIPLLSGVEKIELIDCFLSDEEMAKLRDDVAAISDIKIVWRVYLGKWSVRTDAVAFSVLIYTYDYQFMHTADIQVLKYCTDLQALDLGHQSIADISVIGDYLQNLRVLILADNSLTDLSPLAKLPHLHYLEFFVNNVTDLTPLASCTQLVDLNISYNHNLSDITPILHLPKLERLWLEHCNVSEDDIALLEKTYPNAKIVAYGKGSIDQGWRVHPRYDAMIDMFKYHTDTISEEFSKYD